MSNQPFECSVCKACGCGVLLFNTKGNVMSQANVISNPQSIYCKAHIPTITFNDDQILTTQQKINLR